jgi:hypothetical protein
MNTTQSRVFRTIGVTGLLAGPLSLIVATVLQWMLQSGMVQSAAHQATVFEVIAQNQALWLLVGVVSVFGPLVWLAGIPAAIGLARERGWVLTSIGGGITALGLVAGVGHLALYFGTYAVLATDGVSNHVQSVLGRAADAEPLANALLVVFLIAFSLGPILLTIGLRRAKAIAVWVPVAAIVMTVANFVGGPVAGIVQLCALVIVFAPIVVAVLRSPARPQPAQAPAGRDRGGLVVR